MKVNYAVVFVSEMQTSVAFYRDVVGLTLKFETSHWTEFATEGATHADPISYIASEVVRLGRPMGGHPQIGGSPFPSSAYECQGSRSQFPAAPRALNYPNWVPFALAFRAEPTQHGQCYEVSLCLRP
jgi:catechol 2,3-dioxygenase-like lactoylglutathione lyase family enzyme